MKILRELEPICHRLRAGADHPGEEEAPGGPQLSLLPSSALKGAYKKETEGLFMWAVKRTGEGAMVSN